MKLLLPAVVSVLYVLYLCWRHQLALPRSKKAELPLGYHLEQNKLGCWRAARPSCGWVGPERSWRWLAVWDAKEDHYSRLNGEAKQRWERMSLDWSKVE